MLYLRNECNSGTFYCTFWRRFMVFVQHCRCLIPKWNAENFRNFWKSFNQSLYRSWEGPDTCTSRAPCDLWVRFFLIQYLVSSSTTSAVDLWGIPICRCWQVKVFGWLGKHYCRYSDWSPTDALMHRSVYSMCKHVLDYCLNHCTTACTLVLDTNIQPEALLWQSKGVSHIMEDWAAFRMLEHFPLHGIQLVLNSMGQVTEGIVQLHNSAHMHMAYRVQVQLNAMLNMTHPVALNM